MENIDSLQQRLFRECMEVLHQLAGTQSEEELVERQHLILDVSEHISFIKFLDQYKGDLVAEVASQNIDNEITSSENFLAKLQPIAEEDYEDATVDEPEETILEKAEELPLMITSEPSEEESILETAEPDELSMADEPEPGTITSEISEEPEERPHHHFEEKIEEEMVSEASLNENAYEKTVEMKEQEAEENHETKAEKKFKLAHIKGLNKIQSLFDEPEPVEHSSGIAKRNMPLDIMEAEKGRPDFKLDLNDRIAFTQKLFGGSQTELNETIQNLNSFRTLDEAKEYLSDVYYQRNWQKVDDYAQRLWTLVENKFL